MKIVIEKIICLLIVLLFIDTAYSQNVMEVSTDVCVLRLDKINGNLVGLHWLNPNEEIIKESRLGENFRILLPLPNYEANYFISTKQKVRFEKIENGVICHNNKLINDRQVLDINTSVCFRI